MADRESRREDEETSQHDVTAYGAAGGWSAPAGEARVPPGEPQSVWQPPAAAGPAPSPWQAPQPTAQQPWDQRGGSSQQPGWGQQPGWSQQQSSGEPAWQQPAWPQWQQPSYVSGRAPYGSSGGAIMAAVIMLIYGVPLTLFGALATFVFVSLGGDVDPLFRRQLRETFEAQGLGADFDTAMRLLTLVAVIMLVLGIVHVVASIGVLVHKSWGRLLGVVISVLGVLFGVLMLAGGLGIGDTSSLVLAILVLAGYGLSLIGLLSGGAHFRRLAAGRW